MTQLAIRRIFDEGLLGFWVPADNIRGTGFDACPATDAPINLFDGHGSLSLPVFHHYYFFERMNAPAASSGVKKTATYLFSA